MSSFLNLEYGNDLAGHSRAQRSIGKRIELKVPFELGLK